jgi:hypothetical protein
MVWQEISSSCGVGLFLRCATRSAEPVMDCCLGEVVSCGEFADAVTCLDSVNEKLPVQTVQAFECN